ncbi:hypothetical protein [Streptomyces endophyticus]|uniref:Dirigent protein n=1 Tax=Streptomyces endophyticus TaxID=714166 RepID=A0ABU6F6F3_9ACTN|nr:hypothetical protein [Streptomyces endophyticus]MEB8339409.1 hypothetical protein [Streptomyces endophyticus]
MTSIRLLGRPLGLAAASLTVAVGALAAPAVALGPVPVPVPTPVSEPLPTMTVDFGYEDEEPSGSEGQQFDGDARLLDASGDVVGRFYYDCTTAAPGKTTVGALCSSAYVVEGRGEIFTQAFKPIQKDEDTMPRPTRSAVTGGTGDFKGATGQATMLPTGEPDTNTVVFN